MTLDTATFAALAAEHHVHGAVLAASLHGERTSVPCGVTRVDGRDPVLVETRFVIGSVVKPMVALAVAGAIERGDLTLSTSVDSVIGGFGDGSVTIGHLLSHTSGLPDLWVDRGSAPNALAEFATECGRLPSMCPPGERYGYSNAGFAVLGRILESIERRPFAEVMQERVFTPLSMSATFELDEVATGSIAVGASRVSQDDPTYVPVDRVVGPTVMRPAGSQSWATVDDLLTFGELFLLGGRVPEIVSPALLAELCRPVVDIPDWRNGERMSHVMVVDDTWGTRVLMHDGGVAGQAAYLRVIPAQRAVLALVCAGGVPQRFHRRVFEILADERLGMNVAPDVEVDRSVRVDTRRYIGRYSSPSFDALVEVDSADPSLGLTLDLHHAGGTRSGPRPLAPVDHRLFMAPLDGRQYSVAFELDAPPDPAPYLLAGGRLLRRTHD